MRVMSRTMVSDSVQKRPLSVKRSRVSSFRDLRTTMYQVRSVHDCIVIQCFSDFRLATKRASPLVGTTKISMPSKLLSDWSAVISSSTLSVFEEAVDCAVVFDHRICFLDISPETDFMVSYHWGLVKGLFPELVDPILQRFVFPLYLPFYFSNRSPSACTFETAECALRTILYSSLF